MRRRIITRAVLMCLAVSLASLANAQQASRAKEAPAAWGGNRRPQRPVAVAGGSGPRVASAMHARGGFDEPVAYQNSYEGDHPGDFDPSGIADNPFAFDHQAAGDCTCSSDPCCHGEIECYSPYSQHDRLAAGVEATYLSPSANSSFIVPGIEDRPFEAAPRIWVQLQDQIGWGLRCRYWDFDADEQFSGVFNNGIELITATVDDDLEVNAVDLEVTRMFRVGILDCWAGLGARHGRLQRQLTVHQSIFDLSGGGGDDATVVLNEIDREFEGTGITMSLDMRRPISRTRLAAICNLRGSVLWGENRLDDSLSFIEVVPAAAGTLALADFQQPLSSSVDQEGMWIGELQAGGEWSAPLNNAFGGNAFLRVLFEAQWWNLPGITGSIDGQLYEFLGVTVAAGFTR